MRLGSLCILVGIILVDLVWGPYKNASSNRYDMLIVEIY